VDGLEALGLEMLVAEPARLPQLNSVKIPPGVDDAAVRRELLEQHGLEIGSGLGDLSGKIWRIGLMGETARPQHVDFCLQSLKSVLDSGLVAAA
jgi:alanine-glyoxylate transaminase/serine-glyoxylate transaminase/serine-pyruvate transaminase